MLTRTELVSISKRDSATRFSISGIFHESVSPKPLSLPLGPFQIFSKIFGDIRSSRCTTAKWQKSSIKKVLIIFWGKIRNDPNVVFGGLGEDNS
jgi:hypothetical protein